MKAGRFEGWTRAGGNRSSGRGERPRRALILCGLLLLISGSGLLFLELRGPGAESPADAANLRLRVPEMKRVDGLPVTTAPSDDEAALRQGPVRLAGTGLPWQREPNVYISGHRLGYPGTGSFLVFRDLNGLGAGDRVILRDGEGRRYSYRVFDKRTVGPGRLSVTEPVQGHNIVTLQTCTLPDYRKRIVVRAELVNTSGT